jgi:tyrosine-protein kinase Etk/Wzc
MSQYPDNQQNKVPPEWNDEYEIKMIDLIYPIFQRRKFLVCFCLGIALLTGIISYFSARIYEATAIILPITEDSSSSITKGLASTFLEQFGISGLGSSSTTSSDVYGAFLKSNELTGGVLQRYDYFPMMGVSKYGENNTIKSFAGMVKVTESEDDPSLSVSLQSDDPVFAANLVNSYVKELNKYNLNNSFTSARYLTEYLEKRMEEADMELDQAQMELRKFQEKHSAISISQQAQATLKILGEMQAKVVSLEVDKAAKEKFYRGSHIQIEQLDAQMEALQKNIDQLTYSQEHSVSVETEGGKIEFYIPLNSIPGLNFDESKLLLKTQAKTSVVTLLTTQMEQAKLEEAKDIPTINVLEWANTPTIPVKPNIKLYVILSLVASLFLGIFIIFIMEFLGWMDRDPESAPKWQEIKNSIKNFFKFRKRFRW